MSGDLYVDAMIVSFILGVIVGACIVLLIARAVAERLEQ